MHLRNSTRHKRFSQQLYTKKIPYTKFKKIYMANKEGNYPAAKRIRMIIIIIAYITQQFIEVIFLVRAEIPPVLFTMQD